jgi:hypothetical protein
METTTAIIIFSIFGILSAGEEKLFEEFFSIN